jgi:hypothetical protein
MLRKRERKLLPENAARAVRHNRSFEIDDEAMAALVARARLVCEELAATCDPLKGRIELLTDILFSEISNFPFNVFECVRESATGASHDTLGIRVRADLDGYLTARALDRLGIARH